MPKKNLTNQQFETKQQKKRNSEKNKQIYEAENESKK